MHDIQALIERLQASKHTVVLTGAGISTLSGIPDFRGKKGIYRRSDIDADRLFSIDAFYDDPSYYYIHAKELIYNLAEKQPNVVHNELARLEAKGLIQTVCTQNIDLLHQKAGSNRVLELHGSPSIHRCLSCAACYSFSEVLEKLVYDTVPTCSCSGILKPDIVFFGEGLPREVWSDAQDEAEQADLMLVLGSSLTVYPAAGLPECTRRFGGSVALVNADPTPLDASAVWIGRNLEETFTALQRLL